MAETWLFEDIRDLTRKVAWLVNVMCDTSVTIIGTYDELRPILNCIVKNTDFELYDVDFVEPMWINYDKEYGITLDSDKNIYVEKVFNTREDGTEVPIFFDNIIFAYKDVDNRILEQNENHVLFDIDDGEKANEDNKDIPDENEVYVQSRDDAEDQLLEEEKSYSKDLLKNGFNEPKKADKTINIDLFDLLFS